jgi:uncharacterized protein YndB with AHSA1/START domain
MNDKGSITIEWDFYKPPDKIWDAWIDPNIVKKWFGSDPKGKVISAKMNVEIGEKFEVTFIGSDNIVHTCYGEYKKIMENEELIFTWNWKSEPDPVSEVSVILLPTKYGTKMIFKHSNLYNESAHNYEIGWTSTFHKLEEILN